ncbi:MAG: DUF2294 family protein [Actinobacteria bacterium]|nr:DUF2294 family protein [Actinomycetota bacterium]
MDAENPMQRPEAEKVKKEIAKEISRVHLETYGERTTNLKVALDEQMVAVMMDVELSPAEQALLGVGKADAVRSAREAYQEAIEEVFVAIVERATGRRVDSFASRTVVSTQTPWSAEIFRLQPSGSG